MSGRKVSIAFERLVPSPHQNRRHSHTPIKKAGSAERNRPENTTRVIWLGLFLLHVDFRVDARRHQLKLLQTLLSLLAPGSAGIEFDRLLIGFNGSRRKLYYFFVADFLRCHLG